MNRKLTVFAMALIVAEVAATFLLYPHMTAQIPAHWNIHGQADRFGPRYSLFFYGPGLTLLIVVFGALAPWLSPRPFNIESFGPTYRRILARLFLLFAYIDAVMLWAAAGHAFHPGRAILTGASLILILLGNLMGKVRPNFYVGFRTPWTLASERVWRATHRFGAYSLVLCGLLGCIGSLFGLFLPVLVLMVAGSFAPALYSLIYSKQLERRGEV